MTTFVVTQHYRPDDTSTAEYLTTIAEKIAGDDDVAVLSGSRGSARKGSSGTPRVVELSGWTPPKGALVRRGLAMLLFCATVFVSLLRRCTPTTPVIVVTTPFLLPYAAVLAARLKGARSALIVYDLYPDVLINARLIGASSWQARIIRRFNEWLYRSLDAIVIVGRDMERHFDQYRASTAGKLNYIPNWATLPVCARAIEPASPYRAEFPGLVVGLSGNLGFTHDPETVFAAARRLETNPNIRFLLSGWGVGWERLKRLQQAENLRNVRIFEKVPAERLDDFLAAADAWIIPYRKNMAGISVPSRLYNLLAIGRPIIALAEADAEHSLILTEHDVGWVVPPEDPGALGDAIREMALNPSAVAAKGRRAVNVIGDRYTSGAGGRAYRLLAQNLRQLNRQNHQ